MKKIGQGAEAIIYQDNSKIIKHRFKKGYRIKEIDEELRKSRTRREAKILEKLKRIIPVPKLLKTDNKEKLELEFIKGEKLATKLNKDNLKLMKQLGETIAKLHEADVAHGDLTTSNMILKNNTIYLIDFGLSFVTKKIEDKAVDIHLLKEALEAKHHKIYKEALSQFNKGYKNSRDYEKVMKRLEVVESRGRYKGK